MNSASEYALDLFVGQAFVARLEFHPEQDSFSLTYSPAWAADRRGYALSPHLPLDGTASSSSIRRFLEHLLPEGRALDVASVHSNIQKNNVFGLIRHLGQETTGALTFLPAGRTSQALEPQIRELKHSELQERIEARNEVPFTVWDGRVRMSIAGFQTFESTSPPASLVLAPRTEAFAGSRWPPDRQSRPRARRRPRHRIRVPSRGA